MQGYRLYVIRHGATKANEQGIYIGRTDYGLSERGLAELYQKRKKYVYPAVERIYSSPAKRCIDTGGFLFPDTGIVIVDELAEMNLGDFEEKTVEELVKRDDFKKWLKGGKDNPPPNGESAEAVMARVYKSLHMILMNMMDDNIHTAAVVTHAGLIIDMLTGYCIPKPVKESISVPFGEGFILNADVAMWQRSQVMELSGIVPFDKTEEQIEEENEASKKLRLDED